MQVTFVRTSNQNNAAEPGNVVQQHDTEVSVIPVWEPSKTQKPDLQDRRRTLVRAAGFPGWQNLCDLIYTNALCL